MHLQNLIALLTLLFYHDVMLSLTKYMDKRTKVAFNFFSVFHLNKPIFKRRHPIELKLTVLLQQTQTTFL
jgi:hypothetical protein